MIQSIVYIVDEHVSEHCILQTNFNNKKILSAYCAIMVKIINSKGFII